jgi:DNA-directed RNA polymerase specialized sigma subunit
MPDTQLEDEYREPYQAWKSNPTPEASAQMLEAIHPLIERAVRTHVGQPNPLIISRARGMALDALRSYNPLRSRLQSHIFSQLQGLKRVSRQQSQVIQVPEKVLFDQQLLRRHEQELKDTVGRDPSDAELANHTGFSLKRIAHVRGYQPGVSTGRLEGSTPGFNPGTSNSEARQLWIEMVYHDLSPLDQRIAEHAMGLHSKPVLNNQQIAAKLGRSPGAVSQRKAKIQQQLDQEQELSPFLG